MPIFPCPQATDPALCQPLLILPPALWAEHQGLWAPTGSASADLSNFRGLMLAYPCNPQQNPYLTASCAALYHFALHRFALCHIFYLLQRRMDVFWTLWCENGLELWGLKGQAVTGLCCFFLTKKGLFLLSLLQPPSQQKWHVLTFRLLHKGWRLGSFSSFKRAEQSSFSPVTERE